MIPVLLKPFIVEIRIFTIPFSDLLFLIHCETTFFDNVLWVVWRQFYLVGEFSVSFLFHMLLVFSSGVSLFLWWFNARFMFVWFGVSVI